MFSCLLHFFGELILISSQKWKYNYFLKLLFFFSIQYKDLVGAN